MRTITVRYDGECRKCGTTLAVGVQAVYERRVGVFCPGCAPTDPEEIRGYRQEAADRKADRLEEWAETRRKSAGAVLAHNRQHYTSDLAFNTQPGHFPLRTRVIRQNDRAYESLNKAAGMQARADSLRHVQVKGDAERRRQDIRDLIRPTLRVGMLVETAIYGKGRIKRINRKTVTVEDCGTSGTFTVKVDLSWIKVIDEVAAEKGS